MRVLPWRETWPLSAGLGIVFVVAMFGWWVAWVNLDIALTDDTAPDDHLQGTLFWVAVFGVMAAAAVVLLRRAAELAPGLEQREPDLVRQWRRSPLARWHSWWMVPAAGAVLYLVLVGVEVQAVGVAGFVASPFLAARSCASIEGRLFPAADPDPDSAPASDPQDR